MEPYGSQTEPVRIVSNLRGSKVFTLPRHQKLALDVDCFNIFNHPNWQNPNVDLSAAGSVAKISAVGGPNTGSTGDQSGTRSLRLGVRLEW